MERLPLACRALDDMLCGGIESESLTLLYGEAGSGKTTLCMILARNMIETGRKVIYIDSEGISTDRMRQISGDSFEDIMKNLLIFSIVDFSSQEEAVDKAVKMLQGDIGVGMIIIDSITSLYRPSGADADRRSLNGQSQKLSAAARVGKIPVVATSQVFTDVEKKATVSLGGNALMHNSKTIIRFEKTGIGMRRATLEKHRSIPEGITADFRLVNEGIA